MAFCFGGFSTDRFKIPVDKTFLCPICGDVLKDPVQCQNQHYFCKDCIKKHLEKNAKSCPICVQDLNEETLSQPPRILTDYLNGLIISCDHSERGCTREVTVSRLEVHVRECDYRPVVCLNEKCEQTFSQIDLADHVTTACEYRLVHCPECDDNVMYKNYHKHTCVLSKDLTEMRLGLAEVKNVLAQISKSQKEILKLVQHSDCRERMLTSQTHLNDIVNANIMVIGGKNKGNLSSVEVLYPGAKTWTESKSMQESRRSATSVLYGNDVIVFGGRSDNGITDTIERLSLVCKPLKWIPFPVSLPLPCCGHKSAVVDNFLYLVGGYNGKNVYNSIYNILLHPPYSTELKCEMPEGVCFHGLQAFDKELLMFGGSKTGDVHGVTDAVLSYNTENELLTVMKPLPFAMGEMTTVRWEDNVIIIGGKTTRNTSLNTVILYNVMKQQLKMLPSMRHARSSCAATIAGKKIIVMGGFDAQENVKLNSVECFDLDNQTWVELPAMNECRSEATSLVYAGLL